MNHKGTLRIDTKNLILRKFKLSDAEAMYKNWAS
ncbi:N-acetyltransferase, partial [Paraclostridium sp. AKS46]|nr:N-acetyltransferase [Paraclostridium sp. AKS46]